jgi:8-amino-3,8-dideoxy-alpha-D-manno-octulosonate transaminase
MTLRDKKARFKAGIRSGYLEGMSFRRINDPEGECATLLTIQLETAELAAEVAARLNSKPISRSGWHVYNNMEQLLSYKDTDGRQPFYKNMLPRTDDILKRSINLSVGVLDPGLGSDFGIHVHMAESEIEQKAEEFVRLVKPITG